MAVEKSKEKRDRREIVLDAAAIQFARRGYDATTMRDIAKECGILPGSLYYHFESKEEMFLAVHERAINYIVSGALLQMNPDADPWTRLCQASEGYLATMLSRSTEASLIITEFPLRRNGKLRAKLIADRERFENVFKDIVAELPLAPGVDRTYWRLALLGMLAWTYIWFNSKGDSPKVVAQNLINLLKERTASD